MSDQHLIVTARFPAGQFNATGERGRAEWPPSPDRLLGALLSVAPESVDVRQAYTLAPPTIITPPHGTRDSEYQRWVPIQVELTSTRGMTRQIPDTPTRNLRAPEKGTLLDPTATVTWIFPGGGGLAGALADIAADVAYLGRPTSPVILTVTSGAAPEAPEGHSVWTPAAAGNHHISVGCAERLGALDAAHRASVAATRGSAPALMVGGRAARTFVRYTVDDGSAATGYAPAADAAGAAHLSSRTVMGIAGAPVGPGAAACMMDALVEAGATEVHPVIAFDPHLRQERLLGAIVAGPVTTTTMFAYDRIAELRPRPIPGRAFARAAGRAVSSSDLWTTSAPVPADLASIRAQLTAIAANHDVEILTAAAHPEDAATGWQTCDDRLDITHVSVRFSAPFHGPIALSGVTLLPRSEHA